MLENQNCKILADSINPVGCRLTSILFKRFPYCLIQEPATHRLNSACAISSFSPDMSRNSASTRAIPLKKLIDKVLEDPFIPTFELNQRGMSGVEISDAALMAKMQHQWIMDMQIAINQVQFYEEQGIHKSKPSKLLIPWLRIPIIISSTNWGHFFDLRCAENADVDLREQAQSALDLFLENTPQVLKPDEWHIPFECKELNLEIDSKLKVSAANIARISYFNFDGQSDYQSSLKLADSLIEDGHMSPFEHIAQALSTDVKVRNYNGFRQYRAIIEGKSIGF